MDTQVERASSLVADIDVQLSEAGPEPAEWLAALAELGCDQPAQTPGYFAALKLDVSGSASRAAVCVARRAGRIVGLATVVIGPAEIAYKVGERRLGSWMARGLRMVDLEPIAADEAVATAMLRALLALSQQVVVFDRYCYESGPWSKVVANVAVSGRYGFYVPWGRTKCCSIRLPQTWDAFMAGLHRKVRHELRRKVERVTRECGADAVTVQSFSQPESVERLRAAVLAINQHSWQGKRNVAVRSFADDERYLQVLAREGLLLAYVLFIRGEPTAFAFGIRRGTHYHMKEIAYAQQAKALSPGQVLIYMVLRDLLEKQHVRQCNFGYGKARYKDELCNRFEHVAILWLPRRTVLVGFMMSLHRVLRVTLSGVGALLDWLKLKQRTLTWLRSG